MKSVMLHIGTHKTGTTSFQKLLEEEREALSQNGVRSLPALDANKIAVACIRDGCPIPPLTRNPHWVIDRQALYQECRQSVEDHLKLADSGTLVISCEHLSFFREPEECTKLRGLFPPNVDIEVVVVLRPKAAFLESYRRQVAKSTIHDFSSDPTSPYYCERDSWLLDYDRLLRVYGAAFERVVTLDYDSEDMVGKLLKRVGISDWEVAKAYRHNVSPSALKIFLKNALLGTPLYRPASAFHEGAQRLLRRAFGGPHRDRG